MSGSLRGSVVVHPEVDDALASRRPVVALETAVLTHGLPREGIEMPPEAGGAAWDDGAPANLQAVSAMEQAVRDGGAVPATIGVLDGRLHIGLADDELHRLALDSGAEKASAATLAGALAGRANAGTTVGATLVACGLPSAGAVRVFATGGIGGVHPGLAVRPDVSGDLALLARTPTAVVCAGAKSILDLPATLEALETLGVPVVGYRTDAFPRFYTAGTLDLEVSARANDADDVARICAAQWRDLRRSTAVLVTQDPPPAFALDDDDLARALARAEAIAERERATGAARTPMLLAALADATNGRSLITNVALLRANAALAASVARAWAGVADS